MKVAQLIKELLKAKPDSNVFLSTDTDYYDFTGVSFDDNSDINLYIVADDKKA